MASQLATLRNERVDGELANAIPDLAADARHQTERSWPEGNKNRNKIKLKIRKKKPRQKDRAKSKRETSASLKPFGSWFQLRDKRNDRPGWSLSGNGAADWRCTSATLLWL